MLGIDQVIRTTGARAICTFADGSYESAGAAVAASSLGIPAFGIDFGADAATVAHRLLQAAVQNEDIKASGNNVAVSERIRAAAGR